MMMMIELIMVMIMIFLTIMKKKFMTPHVNETLTGNRAALWAKERKFIRGVYSQLSTFSLKSAFHDDAQTKNINS